MKPFELDMKKRIAIFLPSLSGGGAEKSMLKLAIGIARRNFPVDIVLGKAEGPYRTHLADLPEGVRVVDLKASRILLALPALVQYLRYMRPYALLSTLDYANVVAIWARFLAGTPEKVVVLEQNTISLTSRHSHQLRQRLMPHLVRYFYPWADHIIGNSQGVVNDLMQITGLSDNQIKVIYNPVVMPGLRDKAKENLNHPWFESGQPPVLLAVGRLTAQKDFPTLIRAFAQLRQSQLVRLVILGEGPDRASLELLIREMGLDSDIKLLGFVENPYAYMMRASLFVLSSGWEGLPTVLIEALFCGVPVVSTDCPSGPREILADGKYGALVPVQEPTALAKIIQMALDGNTPRPSQESWQPYELETVVDEYLHILAGD